MYKINEAESMSYNYDPNDQIHHFETILSVNVRKKGQMKVFRFLFAKLWNDDKISLREIRVMLLLYYRMIDEIDNSRADRRKWLREFLSINSIIKYLGRVESNYSLMKIKLMFPRSCLKFVLDPFQYFGMKNQPLYRNRSFKSFYKRIKLKKAELKVIGVGYNDKGQCSNNSTDGSPHWREIATSEKMRETDECTKYKYSYYDPPDIFGENGDLLFQTDGYVTI